MEKLEKLKAEFAGCTAEEKMHFIQAIMPEICNIFLENQEKFMQEMMPVCMQAMNAGKMDMPKMMGMFMNMMKGKD